MGTSVSIEFRPVSSITGRDLAIFFDPKEIVRMVVATLGKILWERFVAFTKTPT